MSLLEKCGGVLGKDILWWNDYAFSYLKISLKDP